MPARALSLQNSPGEGPAGQLHCDYFDAGRCRSCVLIETPYSVQLRDKEQRCQALLPRVTKWLPSFSGGDRGFRNRVKLVVGGKPGRVTLGILGPDGHGVDLRECAIQSPEIAAVIPSIAAFLESTNLPPYDVPERRGELKFVHITAAPFNESNAVSALMVRFVVRTERSLEVLRSRLDALRDLVPHAVVISVNLLPEHKAVLEGEQEVMLLGSSLAMRLGFEDRPLTLHLMPQSFFQTNTDVARELYAQVADWAVKARPASLWDLYCGVGGFALHCALALQSDTENQRNLQHEPLRQLADCEVLGVELSEAAIDSASRSANEAGLNARFVAADATEFALVSSRTLLPEMLVVNPPRRGIGAVLAKWIEASGIPTVVYSSCNPESLARDLDEMPSYVVREGRLFDMFPHTSHLEVAVLLQRETGLSPED